jgi:hypothetical protein
MCDYRVPQKVERRRQIVLPFKLWKAVQHQHGERGQWQAGDKHVCKRAVLVECRDCECALLEEFAQIPRVAALHDVHQVRRRSRIFLEFILQKKTKKSESGNAVAESAKMSNRSPQY